MRVSNFCWQPFDQPKKGQKKKSDRQQLRTNNNNNVLSVETKIFIYKVIIEKVWGLYVYTYVRMKAMTKNLNNTNKDQIIYSGIEKNSHLKNAGIPPNRGVRKQGKENH